MDKINILWIAASVPSKKVPHAGGQTFNYYFKSFLACPEFELRLVALNDGIDREIIDDELNDINKYIIYKDEVPKIKKVANIESKLNLANRHAGILSNYCADEILRRVKQYKAEGYYPDIVILEWTGIVLIVPEIRQIYPECKIVASEHDVTFVGYGRMANYYKGLKGCVWEVKYKNEKKLELDALKLCDLILVQNWDNRNLLMQEGLHEENIQWLVPFFNDMRNCTRKPNGKDILFFGAMARPENYLSAIWFIERVMPLIEDMDVRFVVLGSNPPEELKRFESSRVHITGFVDSIIPFFENAVCLVAPLVLGAGIKVKIIEALSSGVPVLTNDIGIEGISAKDGREYIHCVEPSDFEGAIREIFANPSAGAEMEINAKSYIEKNYLLEKSLSDYKNKLLELGERK